MLGISKSKHDKISLLRKREQPVKEFHGETNENQIDLYIFHTSESKGAASDYQQVPHEHLVYYKNGKPEYIKTFTGKNFGEGERVLEEVRQEIEKEKGAEAKPMTKWPKGHTQSLTKEPWEYTQQEIREWWNTIEHSKVSHPSAMMKIVNVDKKIQKESYDWYTKMVKAGAEVHQMDMLHRIAVAAAIAQGNIVPAKVIKDYPDLKPRTRTRKVLPEGAQNPQTVPLDSTKFVCYGKDLGAGRGKGYRVYCRKEG